MLSDRQSARERRLDQSARAGWLYYVAGYKQDDIATQLGVSRQTAQRLVSMSVKEKLISIRLEHPIMRCMDLAEQLKDSYGLRYCEVVPSKPDAPDSIAGLAQAGAAAMERELSTSSGRTIAVGTGRNLRACVEDLLPMNRPDHTIVALLGHMMPGGLSTRYNVIVRLADRINAGHYPMPLPIYARSPREKEIYQLLETIRQIHKLARAADVSFVGVGHIGADSPLFRDGFLGKEDLEHCLNAGAVGEITGWHYDDDGQLLAVPANERVNSVPLVSHSEQPVYGVAAGVTRARAIRGAIRGGLINSLITNETTAEAILTPDR